VIAQFDEARLLYERAEAVDLDRESVQLATVRHQPGFSAYFEMLDAQTQLLAEETNLAELRRDRLVAIVDLYRAEAVR
jgi:outer membrane protein TolC